MDKVDVAQLLKLNKLNFGYLYKDLTREELELLLSNWTYQLKDVTKDMGNQAFLIAQRECIGKPVDISSIFAALGRLSGTQDISVGELWELMVKTAFKIADNYGCYNYTAIMEDGRTQGQYYRDRNKILFEKLPLSIRKWVGSANAMIEIGRTCRYELEKFTRPKFEREIKSDRKDNMMLDVCNDLMIGESHE